MNKLKKIVFLRDHENERLALIRSQLSMWTAEIPAATDWDAAFLLRIIDRLMDEK